MKKVKMISAVIVCITALISNNVKAQQQPAPARHEFSIQQCLDYAHNNNVQVKNALIDYKIQVQTNRNITAGALPKLTASGGITDYIDIPTNLLPAEFFGGSPGTFIPLKFGTKYNANGTVALTQTLFDGQVFVGLQARRTSLDYAMKGAEVTEQTVKVNIYKIYYQLVVSKSQLSILDANIVRLEKQQHDAQAMHDNGFAEQLDVDRITVQLANYQTEKLKAQANIDNGYLSLKYLMGMPMSDELALTDDITEDQIKIGVLDDTTYQYTDRKDYQYLQLLRKLGEYNVKRYKLSYLPVLSFNGQYTKLAQRTKFDIFGKGDWFTTSFIGINLNIPIFDGFAKASNVEKSKLELQQYDNRIQDLKLNIDNATATYRKNFKTAILTLDFQKKNMALAEQVYNQAKKKYEAGVGDATGMTNAEADLKIAQNNYISAMYDAIIAKIDYNNATGKL